VYSEQQSIRISLQPGRNTRYVRIPNRLLVGRIRFDPSVHPGDVVLHSLEVRRDVERK
jgi:hypothetical protein